MSPDNHNYIQFCEAKTIEYFNKKFDFKHCKATLFYTSVYRFFPALYIYVCINIHVFVCRECYNDFILLIKLYSTQNIYK